MNDSSSTLHLDPCEPHRITLSAALDGELQGPAMLAMAESVPHLAGCAECQEFIRRARALDAALAADLLDDENSAHEGSERSADSESAGRSPVQLPHAPRALWKRIEAEAWETERATAARKERWAWRVAAGLLLALAGAGLWNSIAERPASAGLEASSREGRGVSEFNRQREGAPATGATSTTTSTSDSSNGDSNSSPNSTLRFGS